MKKLLYICSLCITLFACNEDELSTSLDEGLSSIQLKIESQGNTIISKAVSSDKDERFIDNIYVFIFNEDGSIAHREFQDVSVDQSLSLTINDVLSGTKEVVVIANIDNPITNITSADLNAITSKVDLLELKSSMKECLVERGLNFLMSGMKNVTLRANVLNDVSVDLDRVDSKIRFNIKTKAGVTFTPLDWRVVSLPQSVSVLPAKESDLFEYTGHYGESTRENFEVPDGTEVHTFAFYALENKVSPLKEITTEEYALRDKQIKTPIGDGTDKVTNGEFEYARKTATYVEFRGNVNYKPNNETEISADAKYIVHLGAIAGVNDYNNLRNTSYTYNVQINSVDDIIVEVDSNERRPGVEGDVVNANVIKELDAHNEIFNLMFFQENIDESLTWNIYTPFSSGAATENPLDYNWIHFALCSKGSSYYTNDLTPYKGDNSVYTDEELIVGDTHQLDRYMADITDEKGKMLNIKQLIEILKECKRRYLYSSLNPTQKKLHLLDSGDDIKFTAYVKEYYYDVNPTNPSETVEAGLWKKFVNEKKRVVNILSNLAYSADGNSTKSNALYSIRQASIQTMYNKKSTDNFTAWGLQMIQDKTLTQFENYDTGNELLCENYEDNSNGRKNSINMWLPESRSWDFYIAKASWKMKADYAVAKYKCLRLNRDNDGDGTIDQNEVQWYLSSINQLTDMWIGENSYANSSRLYTETTWEKSKQWFASSTVITRQYTSGLWPNRKYRDDSQILWSAEGSSVGALSQSSDGITANVYYRCVRNLGLPKDALLDTEPDDFAVYNKETRILSLDRLDDKSIRGFPTFKDLSSHDERSAENKPWRAFEIAPTNSSGGFSWQEVQDKSNSTTLPVNRICTGNWHVPNQRELALIHSRVTSTDPNLWLLPNHFTRTHFSFTRTTSDSTARPGFSVTVGGGVLNLLNGGEKGGVRCVRDVVQ